MSHFESDAGRYEPGPAMGAEVRKGGELWTLMLVRDLRHSPAVVWEAITRPEHLREWAPFEAEGNLDTPGAVVKLTWIATGAVTEVRVTQAQAPHVLEFENIRWELKEKDGGTRLILWHSIPPRFVAWGAAGWHVCIDVLDRLLAGRPIGRIAGADMGKREGWHRLAGEYARQFGNEGEIET